MENKKFKALKLCWICNKRFYGNMKYLVKGEDGEEHLVHKSCANENNYWIIQDIEVTNV